MSKSPKKSHREKSADGEYYYADGKRVKLDRADDLLAVDGRRLDAADLSASVRAAVERVARPLVSGMRLLDCAALDDPDALRAIAKTCVLHPVFRSHGAILVVLPEVRVEESRGAAKQRRLKEWLETHAANAVIKSQDDGCFTIELTSGYGGDALALANALAEEVNPEMAQAHFVRVVQRPSSTMRS